ncbi:hypothetical protein LUU34_01424100 [Aix galericulata]|nr:hypothetical protein LUU34_01424100 [Aix galericulata]
MPGRYRASVDLPASSTARHSASSRCFISCGARGQGVAPGHPRDACECPAAPPPPPPQGTAHLDGQVVAGPAVVVLVQHLGDIAVVKLVARQAGRPPLGTQRGQRRCPLPPARPRPRAVPEEGLTGPFVGARPPPHPVLQRLAVLRPLRPLPAVGLHEVDAELDERPRRVLLVREGNGPVRGGEGARGARAAGWGDILGCPRGEERQDAAGCSEEGPGGTRKVCAAPSHRPLLLPPSPWAQGQRPRAQTQPQINPRPREGRAAPRGASLRPPKPREHRQRPGGAPGERDGAEPGLRVLTGDTGTGRSRTGAPRPARGQPGPGGPRVRCRWCCG